MISVIASIQIKPLCKTRFLEIFKANVPAVKTEKGCLEYSPTVDVETELPRQNMDADRIVIVEKWSSLDALRAHLAAPHMAAYREKVKDLVAGSSLMILQDA